MQDIPKAILFDLGGTLLRETRLNREAAISWLLEAGTARPEVIKPQLLDLYAEIRQSLRAGRTEFPIRGFLNLALDLSGARTAASIDDIELEFWKRLCSMEPLPGIGDVLAEIQRRGIKTAVVSNAFVTSRVLCYELERNGLLDAFHVVISSADYGIQKPHPLIFQAALTRIGSDPSETWFAGDNFEKDVVGATNVGMRAVWLTQDDVSQKPPGRVVCIKEWDEFLPLLADHQTD